MSLSPGSRIGPYEVSGKLGEGGMGEVYRARDSRLNRDVALKALPASFIDDPERIARFQREAQVLASLSHPNIAAIYGLEESAGAPTLVMELIEGVTLAERIAAGPVPIEEALAIARQIADALEAAHEKGIIHRDLKPANIKLTPDGKVKVLDFGLAKAFSNEPAEGGNPANSPTITLTLESTRAGMILGTAGYMSPEQARGKPVDKRADIWAFGVVLYEMLTGHVAFEGETVTDSLAAILRADIEWHRLPADTPAWVRRLLQRCLERDPKRRLRDMGDAWIEADAPAVAPASLASSPPARNSRWWIPWAAAVLLGGAGIAWGLFHKQAELPRPVVRSSYTQEQFFGLVALSRDGSRLAYSEVAANSPLNLVLRMQDQLTGRPIPGSDTGIFPFFSPDGEWVAYFTATDRKLKKVPIAGGTPVSIADQIASGGGEWADDDTIFLGSPDGLMRVAAVGGKPQAVTKLDASNGETTHLFPHLVPGKNALLFTVGLRGSYRIALHDLKKGGPPRVILENASSGRYLPTGHLVFLRGNGLYAAPFDLAKLAVAGPEVPVVDGVSGMGNGAGDFAISDAGTLVYMAGTEGVGKTVLGMADTKGVAQAVSDEQAWGVGRLSPDGKRIANEIHGAGQDTGDVWILEIERKASTRISFEGRNVNPIWSPDGRTLFWGGKVSGKIGIFSAPSDGSARPKLILETEARPSPGSMTPDGRTLLYSLTPPGGKTEIWAVSITAAGEAGKPSPVRQSSFNESGPELSPDGKWLAYESAESGGLQVYVQPFPGPGGKTLISTQTGKWPRWSRNGKELYYWGGVAGTQLSRVAVQTAPAFHVGAPEVLFNMNSGTTWDIFPDGKHFLVEQPPGAGSRRMITVVNWFEELKKRAPLKR